MYDVLYMSKMFLSNNRSSFKCSVKKQYYVTNFVFHCCCLMLVVAADLCRLSMDYYTITKTLSSCTMHTDKFGSTSKRACERTHHGRTSHSCHAAHCPWSLFPEVRLYYSANIAAKLQLWHFSNRRLVGHWVFYQFSVSIKCILTTAQFNSPP